MTASGTMSGMSSYYVDGTKVEGIPVDMADVQTVEVIKGPESVLYLWWPRQAPRLAGVLYVRFRKGRRIFWRDLHAVTGIWVSGFALFLLLTGLPWASSWGKYLEFVRSLAARAAVRQNWTTGRSSEIAKRVAMNPSMPGMPGMNMEPSPAMPISPQERSCCPMIPTHPSIK